MKKNMKILSLVLLLVVSSCSDYLDIEPTGLVIPKSVEEYRAFLTAAYSFTTNHKVLTAYRSDELNLSSASLGVEQYKDNFIWNDVDRDPNARSFPYADFYTTIFYVNHIIDQKENITGDSEEVQQLLGEAYALRALQYFELLNLYAEPYNQVTASADLGVPVVTIYELDRAYSRESVEKVYTLILDDIAKSKTLLNLEVQPTGLNYRFSKQAVSAFATRVYLFQQEWQLAINEADAALAINNALLDLNIDESVLASEYDTVESILALEPSSSFDLSYYTSISSALLNTYNPTEDLRYAQYFISARGEIRAVKNADDKYKCSFRTSELYLSKAESYAALNQLSNAVDALRPLIKARYTPVAAIAYENELLAMSQEILLEEILNERFRELAIEGHRWNDLRRTSRKAITKIYDGIQYQLDQNDDRYTIPFPVDATINNPNLN
ncbi:RagB/SusD family nutrient uptake outer membrane protein [Flavivirga spongiicola]|uniref:RagB/SusD family nutrient uptake outer membrane protein n=1 Tax=Flavivirga spongiicola TaxID=421621 RepID=A0ABU7XPC3_9FLAO|nr:RagB/SusD family nutrient uptake outer membrane protein [Flavivirga sp. MEBiC05379]MDO5981381.1 RagB/SusD family nutrient uptake outer membrane protein [Flavivirga sp. MEBiC05379]